MSLLYNSKITTMKKLLFVLALVAVYGVSMAMSSSHFTSIDKTTKVTVVADADEKTPTAEKEKAEKATTKALAAKGEAKADGCGEAKAKEKSGGCAETKAKTEGCAKKTKSDCALKCEGEKKE